MRGRKLRVVIISGSHLITALLQDTKHCLPPEGEQFKCLFVLFFVVRFQGGKVTILAHCTK